ncbi:hypothetical protein AVO42_00530 [Thiomicrospira sp. XS5]|uniref:hypothetical protein n=1 Tax=Thiomicrospira sp. XS5 TaxID=1775636 RepID=UPI000747C2B2|nr:hypothetical protein [Thiomicrospira sp. XS5]KUJ73942.1 hypothetical protein AVO42_00530 [Thiomicrospira sp. XS5]
MFLDLSNVFLFLILATVAYGLAFAFYKLVQDRREYLVLYFLYAFVLLVFIYFLFSSKMQVGSSQLVMVVLLVALVSAILAKFSVYWHARLQTLNRRWVWEVAYLVVYFLAIYGAVFVVFKEQWLWAYV